MLFEPTNFPPVEHVQMVSVLPEHLAARYPRLVSETKPAFKAYADYPVTEQDKENIAELFRILATYSPIRLGKKRGYLERELGPAVGRVYPLRMMEYFTNTPSVKMHVARLRVRSIMFYGRIWPNFIGPIGKDLEKLADRGDLDYYARDFAKAIGKDENQIRTLFHNRNWTALYDYLLGRTDDR